MLQIKIVRDIQIIQGTLASPAAFRQTKQVMLRSESMVCPSGFVVRMQCEIPLSGDISPNSESCLNNSDQNKQNQLPGGWKIRIIREDLFSGDGFLLGREDWRIF